jgi:hypothetical protein
LSSAGKWVELKDITLSEVNHAKKAKSLLSHMWNTALIQMQQYHEKLVTLTEGYIQEE